MSIERLIQIAPPPAKPDEPFEGPWRPIELEFGRYLPDDYKEFVRLYGLGSFMEFLCVFVPKAKSQWVRIETVNLSVRGDMYFNFTPDERPYPAWPDPGGLIQCGLTDFGDQLFWLPLGPPDEWKIVVWGRGFQKFELFDCGLTDFLAGVATGEIVVKDFPGDLSPDDRMFVPFSEYGERE
jgi:hypothetical protein